MRARRQHIGSNPIVPNMADYTNWIYYDRIIFAAGTSVPTQFQLFVVPYNQGGKTKVDTNLTLAFSAASTVLDQCYSYRFFLATECFRY